MSDCETDVTYKRTMRGIYVKAAQSLIRTNVSETPTPRLSAEQVCELTEYQTKIAKIDRELQIKAPTELVLRRLEWEEEALHERRRLLKVSIPTMKRVAQHQKQLAAEKKLRKCTNGYLNAVDSGDSVLLFADEVVSQPSSYTSISDQNQPVVHADIVDEIVTGALGRSSEALSTRLITAINTGTAVNNVPIEDTQMLPDVPTHLI